MHSRILVERADIATKRIAAAAETLAGLVEQPDLVDLLTPEQSRDPQVAELYRREAVAVFLETLVEKIAAARAVETEPEPGKKRKGKGD